MAKPRVLIVDMGPAQPLADELRDECGFDAHALEPRAVDLGQFGGLVRCDGPGAVPVWPRGPYPYSLFGASLPRRLLAIRPDVVFCLGEPSELGVAQTVLTARLLLPRVRIVLWSFENLDRRWHSPPGRLRGWLLPRVLRRIDRVLAASTGAVRLLESQGLPPGHGTVVPLGEDTAVFRPDGPAMALAGDESTFRLLYAGRLVPEKGVDLLLAALAELPPSVTLALAGEGPELAALTAQAARLGLAPRVRFMGRLPQTELAAAMRGADLLVLPSRGRDNWAEQFGMVLTQAMLCGTPVVGSRSGAISEVVGRGGWLFDEGDAQGLALLLARLAGDPERVRGRRSATAAWAARRYARGTYLRALATGLTAP